MSPKIQANDNSFLFLHTHQETEKNKTLHKISIWVSLIMEKENKDKEYILQQARNSETQT